MNTYNFSPTLFDARHHGVTTFKSILDYHKSIEDKMPIDGIVWLCENPDLDKLYLRLFSLDDIIKKLDEGQKNQPYEVWTVLDRQAHIYRTRRQLVYSCIDSIQKQQAA